MMASRIAMSTRGFLLLFAVITQYGLLVQSQTPTGKEELVAAPEAAKRWLESLFEKEKNACVREKACLHGTMPVKPFLISMPTEKVYANFTGVTATGLSHKDHHLKDCSTGGVENQIECRLALKNFQIEANVEVTDADVSTSIEYLIQTISLFSSDTTSVVFHLEQKTSPNVSGGVTTPSFELRNATLSGTPSVMTVFVGKFDLNLERRHAFEKKLADTLIDILRNESLVNYVQTLNAAN